MTSFLENYRLLILIELLMLSYFTYGTKQAIDKNNFGDIYF